MLVLLSFTVLLILPVLAQRCPAVCVSDPPLHLDAGATNVSAIVDNSFGRQCQATLYFADPLFLPIIYSFENISCDGLAVTSFRVPKGVPNGTGCVVWQCAGPDLVTCNTVSISGGSADDTIHGNENGSIGCILNTTQIQTTLITMSTSSRTFTKVATLSVMTLTTSTLPGFSSQRASSGDTTAHWETSQHTASISTLKQHRTIPPSQTPSGTTPGQYTEKSGTSRGATTSVEVADFITGVSTRASPTFSNTTVKSIAASSSVSAVVTSIATTITVLQTITSVLSACAEETSM
ncbi:hypothetical protein F5B17DRAFT_382257 [Nemania serpens]|nr:hypothetical protein F5B17DRAFT_382257 [Nemania serpens]